MKNILVSIQQNNSLSVCFCDIISSELFGYDRSAVIIPHTPTPRTTTKKKKLDKHLFFMVLFMHFHIQVCCLGFPYLFSCIFNHGAHFPSLRWQMLRSLTVLKLHYSCLLPPGLVIMFLLCGNTLMLR